MARAFQRRRLGAGVCLLVLATTACAGGSDSGSKDAAPSKKTCAAVKSLVTELKQPSTVDEPYVFRWRDAFAALDDGSNKIVHDRHQGAEQVVATFQRAGARDVPGPAWHKNTKIDNNDVIVLTRGTSAVHPDDPVLPEPVGAGCPGVNTLRETPSVVTFDRARWSRSARLPDIAAATQQHVLADLPLFDKKQRFVRRCSDNYLIATGKPLGEAVPRLNARAGTSLRGVQYQCDYSSQGKRFSTMFSTDLPGAVELVGKQPVTPVSTPFGPGYQAKSVRSGQGYAGPGWVMFDPEGRGALVIVANAALGARALGTIASALQERGFA